MRRARSLLALLVALLVALLADATVGRAAGPDERLVQLFRITQADAQLAQVATHCGALVAAGREGLSEEAHGRLKAAVERATARAELAPVFLQHYREHFDGASVSALEAFYETPLGRRVADSEARAATPEGMALLGTYVRTLRSLPPSERRRDLAARFERAAHMSEDALRIQLGAMRSVGSAVQRLLPKEARLEPAELEARLAAVRAELEPELVARSATLVLYVYQTFSDRELERYVELVESPPGSWFYGNLGAALDRVLAVVDRALARAIATAGDAPALPPPSELELE